MMECWSIGIVGIKIGNNTFIVLLPLIPSFQYSIVPIFQLGKILELPWKKQVTKMLPIKVRKLPHEFAHRIKVMIPTFWPRKRPYTP
jgi:hypothetical protein